MEKYFMQMRKTIMKNLIFLSVHNDLYIRARYRSVCFQYSNRQFCLERYESRHFWREHRMECLKIRNSISVARMEILWMSETIYLHLSVKHIYLRDRKTLLTRSISCAVGRNPALRSAVEKSCYTKIKRIIIKISKKTVEHLFLFADIKDV